MRYVARTIAMMALSSTALAQQASDPVEHPPYAPELRMELAMLAPGAQAGALRTLPSLVWTVGHPETWDPSHRSYMDFFHDSGAREMGEPSMVEHPAPGSPTPMDFQPMAAGLLAPAFADEQDLVAGGGIIAVETHETFPSVHSASR